MVAMILSSFLDVRTARDCVCDLAKAVGIEDSSAVVLTVAELGNNCVEHGDQAPGLLWIGCGPGRLSLRFENGCERQPDWRTRKPAVVGEFRSGGYGLQLVRAVAYRLSCHWTRGRVVVHAEFS